ncbi:hypothetical protein PV08_08080 [Exophiala spinifera]|uniref:Uncharacterized protein n=1 Tax=Exophiala spinifera TaxID=91928 RepID=A0A0D2B1V3_9EURO|nr:uncharacterized protein PV08_08080 [Exophiala spinifera]KIW12893.1 hypothetical protein PV08_08080 [Exophiala spinifera]
MLSHLSGIASDMTLSIVEPAPGLKEETGLPQLANAQQSLNCSGVPYTSGCSWDEFFQNFGKRPPIFGAFTSPAYSNIGYALLGKVIENVTGKPYAQYLQDAIFKPTNMSRSSVGAPSNTSAAFIPAGTSWYGANLGYERSTGGVYSTNNDLLRFGKAILSSHLLSPAKTRAWMKPRSFTSSTGVFVGEAWEIVRGKNLTSDGHVIDIYTKTGNLYDYTNILVLIPDYDLVLAMNLAGAQSSISEIQVLLSALITQVLPVVDEIGKTTAAKKYTGTFTSGNDSSITLSVDDYGLLVTNFIANGVNVSSGYSALQGADVNTTIRLYPTDLSSGNRTSWRAIYQTSSAEELASFSSELFFPDGSCQSWATISLPTYGMQSLDHFIFEQDKSGDLQSVEAKAWEIVYRRKK